VAWDGTDGRLTNRSEAVMEPVEGVRRSCADEVTVNVRSHSRIGKGDLGTNARRIRLFQAELAKRLAAPAS
jgi:uncharacterized protein (DUF1499 family)